MVNPFKMEGNWYRGNLHAHTSNSDGELSLGEVLEGYKKHNYDFLAITDHGKVTRIKEYPQENFLLLSGIEIDVDKNSLGYAYHLVGINVQEDIVDHYTELKVQEGIDSLKEQGGEVIIAHPYGLGLTTEELLSLQGQLGIEVHNTWFKNIGKGLSSVYWDSILDRGRLSWGFAVDDAHSYLRDAYRGWIMVKASALNKENIISSIKKGLFYSSSGPQIKEVDFDGKRVYVHTSPVRVITFVCDNAKGRSVWDEDGKELLEAEFKLEGNEKYLRIECLDKESETAWTNPLYFKEQNVEPASERRE